MKELFSEEAPIMEEIEMNKDTIEKMIKLKMPGMASAYKEQEEKPEINELTFEQRLTLLIDAEIDSRHNHKIERLTNNAKLSDRGACIEGIKYYADRDLNRDQIEKLSKNEYIKNGESVILVGATGSGKSYIACALGNCACQSGFKVSYIRLPDLLTELALGREQGNYKRILQKYEKTELLILDEWLLVPANDRVQQDILEIIERRYKNKGTIFCSQFSPESWHKRLGGGALADAILDRILSKSELIVVHGEKSMRSR